MRAAEDPATLTRTTPEGTACCHASALRTGKMQMTTHNWIATVVRVLP
jgi:hypothetical protein